MLGNVHTGRLLEKLGFREKDPRQDRIVFMLYIKVAAWRHHNDQVLDTVTELAALATRLNPEL